MSKRNFIYFTFIYIFTLGCSGTKEEKVKNRNQDISLSDSIWIKFSESLEEKNLSYLIHNSLDTIDCTDCHPDYDNIHRFESRFIFENHIGSLIHLDSLSKKEFSTEIHENRLIVNYSIIWKYAEEGGYNLIYEFQKGENNFLFKGMYFVP